MWSKNKRPMDVIEREHVEAVKRLSCGVCSIHGPSDAHELVQGAWFTSIPLCRDCHMGHHNGIHGEHRIWDVLKKTELSVLNDTIEILFYRGR
jgi:hypothetical protein